MPKAATKKAISAEEIVRPITEASYLKIGNEYYSVMKAKIPSDFSLKKYLTELCEEKIEDFKTGMIMSFKAGYEAEQKKLIDKIAALKNKSAVILPSGFLDMPVWWHSRQRTFWKLRPFIYHPIYYTGSINQFSEFISDFRAHEAFSEIAADDLSRLICTVKVKNTVVPQTPAVIGLNEQGTRVMVFGCVTFHCLSDKLCTGDTPANVYFNTPLADLSKLISTTNLFSTARSTMKCIAGDIGISSILTVENIETVTVERMSEWRA